MSVHDHGAEMSGGEIADFLESKGVGALAFGNEDGAYAIPMAFGYDRDHDVCIFQFAFGDESRKRAYLDENRSVSLCVFEWHDEVDWKSVVLNGQLSNIENDADPRAAGVFAAYASVATLEVFDEPLEEMDLSWYRLNIEEKRGRKSVK